MKDSILTSIELTNRLRSIYHLMYNNKQYSIEVVYQEFQINNFSIEQIFDFAIGGLCLTPVAGDIDLTNYLRVKILPYNYPVNIIIDYIKVDVGERCEIPYEYKFHPSIVYRNVRDPEKIQDDDINYIHRLAHSRSIHKYSLLQIDYSKLMNLIDLTSIKCI